MAVGGDDVDDDDDPDMLVLSLSLCWNAALRRCPCDLALVWVHVRMWRPVAAMACGRWLWQACGCNALWLLVMESLSS